MTPERIAELIERLDRAFPTDDPIELANHCNDAARALRTAVAEARAEAYKDAARVCRDHDQAWGAAAHELATAIERAAEAAKGRA